MAEKKNDLVTGKALGRMFENIQKYHAKSPMSNDDVDIMMGLKKPEPVYVELKDASEEVKKTNNFGGSYDSINYVGSAYRGISKESLAANGINTSSYPETVIVYLSMDVTVKLKKGYYQLSTASSYGNQGCNTGEGLAFVLQYELMNGVTYLGESYKVDSVTGEPEPPTEPEMVELKDASDDVKAANQFLKSIKTSDIPWVSGYARLYKSSFDGVDFKLGDIIYISDNDTVIDGGSGMTWVPKIGYYKLIDLTAQSGSADPSYWYIGNVSSMKGTDYNYIASNTVYLGESYKVDPFAESSTPTMVELKDASQEVKDMCDFVGSSIIASNNPATVAVLSDITDKEISIGDIVYVSDKKSIYYGVIKAGYYRMKSMGYFDMSNGNSTTVSDTKVNENYKPVIVKTNGTYLADYLGESYQVPDTSESGGGVSRT